MSSKRYDTNPEKEEILEGLEFFTSEENPDLVNPKEIKELMDKLELKEKMSLIYNLISELCLNREINRKGGISKADFISFLEKKMNDIETKPGIHTIYTVFSNSDEQPIPMTNFCKTAREIGDTEKDEELKELMKNADVYGKEMDFDEFYEMMKEDDNKKNINLKKDKKNPKHNITRKYLWKKEEKEVSEPQEEKSPKLNDYKSKQNEKDYINDDNSITKEEYEPKNSYSYRRAKIERTKKVESPKVEEKHEEKIEESVPIEEKKITLEEIITEKKVEVPSNNTNNTNNVRYRYKFRNRFRREQKEEDNNNNNIEKNEDKDKDNNNAVEENNVEIKEENNIENSESKRYHRRYRANNNINNEGKNENNNNYVMYSRYRRKVEN